VPPGAAREPPAIHAKLDAYDVHLIAKCFLTDGTIPEAGDIKQLIAPIGRPLRAYRLPPRSRHSA
jgi:hypothetical protein